MKNQNTHWRLAYQWFPARSLSGLLIILLSSYGGSSVFAAGKLSPKTLQSIRTNNRSYMECRRETIAFLKGGKISPKRFRRRIEACKVRNPGAALYIDCKKNALKSFGKDPKKLAKEVSSCKKILALSAYDPKRSLPMYIRDSKSVFAGVDFSLPVNPRDLNLPGFNCSTVAEKMKNPSKAEFFLIGNNPTFFSGLNKLEPKSLRAKLGLKGQIPVSGQYVPGFGKIFLGETKQETAVYFPSASCSFSEDRGSSFSGMTLYYLIDQRDKLLYPYFSIAFYNPKAPIARTKHLMKRVRDVFEKGGLKGYKPYRLNKELFAVATNKIKRFDKEGDPLDLCASPREHKMIALIKSRPKDPAQVDYVLFANVEQLCRFGDRVSKRFQ